MLTFQCSAVQCSVVQRGAAWCSVAQQALQIPRTDNKKAMPANFNAVQIIPCSYSETLIVICTIRQPSPMTP